MAKQEIELQYVNANPSGTIEVGVLWNGTPFAHVYNDAPQLVDQNSQLLQAPDEAIRWLLYYLLNLGATAETLATYAGRKLVVDIGPAVQQNISLV